MTSQSVHLVRCRVQLRKQYSSCILQRFIGPCVSFHFISLTNDWDCSQSLRNSRQSHHFFFAQTLLPLFRSLPWVFTSLSFFRSSPISFLLSFPFFNFSFQWLLRTFHFSLLSLSPFLMPTMRSSAQERGLKRNVTATLYLNVDGEATQAGSASLCRSADDASSTLRRHVPNQLLNHNDSCDLYAIHTAIMLDEMKHHVYPHTFQKSYELPHILADLYTAGVYGGKSGNHACWSRKTPQPTPPLYPFKPTWRTMIRQLSSSTTVSGHPRAPVPSMHPLTPAWTFWSHMTKSTTSSIHSVRATQPIPGK